MDWPLVLPDDDGIRPAGPPDVCFYCGRKVGTPHGRECACVTRRVKVRYTYEIEIDVPHFWDDQQVWFHRNESSWCAENAGSDIEEFLLRVTGERDGCPCPYFTCEVVGETDGTPRAKEKEPPETEGD